MAVTPDPIAARRPRRAPLLAQPRQPAWSAGLAPSQRRAADRRSRLQQRHTVQEALRQLTPR